MSDKFQIAEVHSFQKKVQSVSYKHLYEKIISYVYPQLRENPYFGLNIKKLKGKLEGFYRYRIGKFRLFYKIDADIVTVVVIDIAPRRDAYT